VHKNLQSVSKPPTLTSLSTSEASLIFLCTLCLFRVPFKHHHIDSYQHHEFPTSKSSGTGPGNEFASDSSYNRRKRRLEGNFHRQLCTGLPTSSRGCIVLLAPTVPRDQEGFSRWLFVTSASSFNPKLAKAQYEQDWLTWFSKHAVTMVNNLYPIRAESWRRWGGGYGEDRSKDAESLSSRHVCFSNCFLDSKRLEQQLWQNVLRPLFDIFECW
jgi:hypothetical protein